MNFIRKFMGSTTTDELSSIQQGKFFLTRSPNSPKGSLECLYNDAIITIKQTTRQFNYLIIVTRIYAEGELNLKNDSDDDEDYDNAGGVNRDEWDFTISNDLNIHLVENNDGWKVIWNDINGDSGDKFEFVIDDSIKLFEILNFEKVLKKVVYELKYLKEYDGEDEDEEDDDDEEEEDDDESDEDIDDIKNHILKYNESFTENNKVKQETEFSFKLIDKLTDAPSIYKTTKELRVYDSISSTFKPVSLVSVSIVNLSRFKYGLQIIGNDIKFETILSSSMNPVFDEEFKSFIYSFFKYDGKPTAFTVLIKLDDEYKNFQTQMVKCLWETINEQEFKSSNDDYLTESFSNMNISSDDEYETPDEGPETDVSDDEDDDDEPQRRITYETVDDDTNHNLHDYNSGINLGYTNDRSYVVRGNNLGVFQTGKDLKFQTTINNLTNKSGDSLQPEKLMIHDRDQHMVFKDKNDQKLYRMDLSRGKIVEEWDVDEVVNFEPSKKLDPLTGEVVFSGISSQGVFNMDPRIKNIVTDTAKSYKTKTGFSHLVTTESGNFAIGSSKGEIRLYDKIGSNARTLIPSLGDATKGMDVSNDGRWLLVTYDNYLLLLDCKIGKGQRNEGKLGFEKNFNAESKPVPRRLQLKPEHSHIILNTLGTEKLNFTPAFFNTGIQNKETHIVTSAGNYLISWNLKKFLKGQQPNYLVKIYDDIIVGNKFKFDSDDIVIALENDVGIVNKRRFRQFK